MSWMEKLYETYERCAGRPQFTNAPILPPCHSEQQAHLEIVLDGEGNFRRAQAVSKETTPIPVTEESAGRTSKPVPHPLCDKLQYCAGDYSEFGGTKGQFETYEEQLRDWQGAEPNPKVGAVLHYVKHRSMVADLVRSGDLYCGPDRRLLTEWNREGPAPSIFRILTKKEGKIDQGDAFVRWRVEIPGDPGSALWEDHEVRESWIRYVQSREGQGGLCMVTGETVALGENHPKRLRHAADGAKLLSSNDGSGFTFRGRFGSAGEAYGVGATVSQKAHNALRWLIGRQGSRAGEAVFVGWDVGGEAIPDLLEDSESILGKFEGETSPEYLGDAGQHFALRLGKMISGYRAKLDGSAGIVLMGLDSATPGRMAVTFYREFTGSEFLDRLFAWHSRFVWAQRYSKERRFVGAPSPGDIAEAAYGQHMDEKLRKSTVERLLPCITDACPMPRDLILTTSRRASNRPGLEWWEWEKCLGIACALVRGSHPKENYQMALETDRTTRDYLFGRLLAIAENIEERALYVAKEQRDTTAAKLMQRFAMRPSSTWASIELALAPYKTRLKTNRPGALVEREKLLDQVHCMFRSEDFTSDARLGGEFLLGYHCQRAALWSKGEGQDQETHTRGENDEQLAE